MDHTTQTDIAQDARLQAELDEAWTAQEQAGQGASGEAGETGEAWESSDEGEAQRPSGNTPAGPAGGETEAEQNQSDAYTLKHLGQTCTVNREEVLKLAQKGMDYERVKSDGITCGPAKQPSGAGRSGADGNGRSR
jgi:hypothetical protein